MIYLTFVRLRKKKALAFVPFFVLYVFLPILSILFQYHYRDSQEEFLRVVTQQLHVWIPMFSSWWPILLLNDFFDSEGNELLYLYHSPLYFLGAQCLSVFLYSGAIVLFFCVFQMLVSFEIFVLAQLMIESLVISSLTYFLCFLLQNTGAGFLIVIVYCIYINLFDNLNLLSFMSIFPQESMVTQENIELLKGSGLAALIFMGGGFVCSLLRKGYK